MRLRLLALVALSVLAAPGARAQGFDGDWFGTVDCVARDVFDRGSTQARGSVVNDVLTIRFLSSGLGPVSVSGRIVSAGPARLLRLEGSLARGGFATFDGVIVTPRQIHARGVVGETACNVNITPARAPAEAAAPPRAEQPRFGRAIPPAAPADNVPPKPNTVPAPAGAAVGKFAAPTPPPDRPRAGASIQAPQAIERPPPQAVERPVPGASVTGLTPPPPPPTAQATPPRVVPAAPPPGPPAATNPQVADRLACALAGTCGPPGAAPARP